MAYALVISLRLQRKCDECRGDGDTSHCGEGGQEFLDGGHGKLVMVKLSKSRDVPTEEKTPARQVPPMSHVSESLIKLELAYKSHVAPPSVER